jgi:nicotinamide-nucleotide amidase
MKRPANALVHVMEKKGLTIAFAESMTSGLAAHKLCGVKGACNVLLGGIVCYDEKIKTGLLKVNKQIIAKHTAESQEVTDALAKNLFKLVPAHICVAITGLAAEGGSETKSKPVGTVFFSCFYKKKIHRKRQVLKGTPVKIRAKSCNELFEWIVKFI